MSFHITSRWGGDEPNVTIDRMRQILAELDADDDEHPDVSLTHESEWSLCAFAGGLLVWENLEEGGPRHMDDMSRDQVLKLWIELSQGNLEAIEEQPWLAGYGT